MKWSWRCREEDSCQPGEAAAAAAPSVPPGAHASSASAQRAGRSTEKQQLAKSPNRDIFHPEEGTKALV